jgi:hypothetical protein
VDSADEYDPTEEGVVDSKTGGVEIEIEIDDFNRRRKIVSFQRIKPLPSKDLNEKTHAGVAPSCGRRGGGGKKRGRPASKKGQLPAQKGPTTSLLLDIDPYNPFPPIARSIAHLNAQQLATTPTEAAAETKTRADNGDGFMGLPVVGSILRDSFMWDQLLASKGGTDGGETAKASSRGRKRKLPEGLGKDATKDTDQESRERMKPAVKPPTPPIPISEAANNLEAVALLEQVFLPEHRDTLCGLGLSANAGALREIIACVQNRCSDFGSAVQYVFEEV